MAIVAGVVLVGGLTAVLVAVVLAPSEAPPKRDPPRKGTRLPHDVRDPDVIPDPVVRPTATIRKSPWITVPGHDELDHIDWNEAGATFLELVRGHERFAVALSKERRPTPETVEAFSGPMMKIARWMQPQEPPPDGEAARIPPRRVHPDHPAFAGNAVAALLHAAKRPLGATQLERLNRVVQDHSGISDILVAAPPDAARPRLEVISERARAVQSYHDDVDRILTPEQREIVHPQAVRGRAGLDWFSSGNLWKGAVQGVPSTDRDQFAAGVTNAVVGMLEMEDKRAEIAAVVTQWAGELSHDLFSTETDPRDLYGFPVVDWMDGHVQRTLDLVRRVQSALDLPPEKAAALRGVSGAFLPSRRLE